MGATNKTFSKASQKKLRRSRKPKFEFEVGKSKRRICREKKDKKRKTKQSIYTQIPELREELAMTFNEIREINQQLDEFPPMLAEVREINQQQKELITEINARILDQLNAWDDDD